MTITYRTRIYHLVRNIYLKNGPLKSLLKFSVEFLIYPNVNLTEYDCYLNILYWINIQPFLDK